MEAKIVRRGIPTSPVIDKILERFPELKEGDIISYDVICELSGEEKDSNRFRAIATALKSRLFAQNGLVLDAVPGEGYVVLDPHQRVDFSTRMQKRGVKKIFKGCVIAANTDRARLTESEKAAVDRAKDVAASLKLHELTRPKKLQIETGQ